MPLAGYFALSFTVKYETVKPETSIELAWYILLLVAYFLC